MSGKQATLIAISLLVAQQSLLAPVAVAGPLDGGQNLNDLLSAIAAKNGVMSNNPQAPHSSSRGTTPSAAEVIEAVRSLPAAISYATTGSPMPTPTPEEAATLIHPEESTLGASGANPSGVIPIFGTITQADETLTGLYDDLAFTDLSHHEPTLDPDLFSIGDFGDITDNLLADVLHGENPPAVTHTAGVLTSPWAHLAPLAVPPSGQAESKLESQSQGILLKGFVEENAAEQKGVVPLGNGKSFIEVDTWRTIDLPCGELIVEKGALVFVEQGEDFVKIRACSGPGHVSLRALGGQTIKVGLGEELLIAQPERFDAIVLLNDGIAKRRISRHMLADQSRAFVSEFSIPNLISLSDNAAKDSDPAVSIRLAKIRERLLSKAAVLTVACRHHGRYYFPVRNRLPAAAFSG
jgi:hypothetical protein